MTGGPIWAAAREAALREGRGPYEADIAGRVAEAAARPVIESRMRAWCEAEAEAGCTPTATERMWRRHDLEVEVSREMRADDPPREVRVVRSVAADSAARAATWADGRRAGAAAG